MIACKPSIRKGQDYLLATFATEDQILAVTRATREAGHVIADVFAPYAVHGLDRAMGLKFSRMSWVCFILGMSGAGFMFLFQWWTSAVDWPAIIGGKPLNSWPAFIPITFEGGVLVAGLGTIAVLFLRSRLLPWSRPRLFHPRITNDHFTLVIETPESADRLGAAETLFVEHGAVELARHSGGDDHMVVYTSGGTDEPRHDVAHRSVDPLRTKGDA